MANPVSRKKSLNDVRKDVEMLKGAMGQLNYNFSQKLNQFAEQMNGAQKEVLTLLVFTKTIVTLLKDKEIFDNEEYEQKALEFAEDKDLMKLTMAGPYAIRDSVYKLETIAALLQEKEVFSEEEMMEKAQEIEQELEENRQKAVHTQQIVQGIFAVKQYIEQAEDEETKEKYQGQLNSLMRELKNLNEGKHSEVIDAIREQAEAATMETQTEETSEETKEEEECCDPEDCDACEE